MGSRLLIVTYDRVGPQMAGPAIRAYELARALAPELDVVLATRHEPQRDGDGFEVVGYRGDDAALRGLVDRADVLFAFGTLLVDHPWVATTDVPVIADLYDPAPLEALVMHTDLAMGVQRDRHGAVLAAHRALLERGDMFVCASERQRHLVVGMLVALGRVNPLTFAEDPALEDLVRIVPFGVSGVPPRTASPSQLRDAHPAIAADDLVLLWAGGIYEWLDPVTLVEAVAALDDPSVKAFFMGGRHPTPTVPDMPVAARVAARADELGLGGSSVLFADEWIPYDERGGYLCEADVGVSLHHHHVEATYAFRTRVLDYLWAGLPIVCSDGDTMADLVRRHDLGEVVPPGDVEGLAGGIERLRDHGRRTACGERSARVGADLRWDRVCQPIATFCRDPRRAPDLVAGPSARERTRAGGAARAVLRRGRRVLARRRPT